MLARWTAITDPEPGSAGAANKRAVIESNEAREGRLRADYEKALSTFTEGDREEAKNSLLDISAELAGDNINTNNNVRASKRMRSTEQVPWVRSLRHGVNRNLGDIQMENGEIREALHSYGKALQDDSSTLVVWMKAARAASELGHLHVARRAYESALRMRPGHMLCERGYAAVLQAIGDTDDDVATEELDESVTEEALRLLEIREENALDEKLQEEEDLKSEGRVFVKDGRWKVLIDALDDVLAVRLGRGDELSKVPVGWPVQLMIDGHSTDGIGMVLKVESDSVASPDPNASGDKNAEAESVIAIDDDDDNDNAMGVVKEKNNNTPNEEDENDAPPARDPRRSKRQRGEEPTGEADAPEDVFLEEMNTLARMAKNLHFLDSIEIDSSENESSEKESPTRKMTSNSNLATEIRKSNSSWSVAMTEEEELKEVIGFCVEVNASNSGPFDALQRVLLYLAEKECNQYLSEICLAWMTLRKYGIIYVPGNSRVSLCVAEALLISGMKVKKGKLKKYEEAERLLSLVSITISECKNASETEVLFLHLRCAWLYNHINEINECFDAAHMYASEGLNIAKQICETGVDSLNEVAGPEFAGREIGAVIEQLDLCAKRLKRSSELQKATEEIESAKSGDKTRASNALGLLGPSIRESVKILGLDSWKKSDSESAVRLKKGPNHPSVVGEKGELQKRLKLFGEACKKGKDVVGEVLHASIRLRLWILNYWERVCKEKSSVNKWRGPPEGPDSAAGRMTAIVSEVRLLAGHIKSISTFLDKEKPSPTLEKSGWSLHEVVELAVFNVIALCELFSKIIPPVDRMQGSTSLSGTQKNQRLAFTRCMLAFCRCLELRMKIRHSPPDLHEDVVRSSIHSARMLTILAFSLHVLAQRGCCREEGTSGALMRMYTTNLNNRLRHLTRTVPVPPANSVPTGPGGIEVIDLSEDFTEFDKNFTSSGKLVIFTLSYKWDDIKLIRQQLAQGYFCLYRLPDLETPKLEARKDSDNLQWLEAGCHISKAIGLSFISGEVVPTVPKMNPEICRCVYFMYRKRLMINFVQQRFKTAREIIQEIVNILPDNPPGYVPSLPFDVLDEVVSSAVEGKNRTRESLTKSVSHMRKEWESAKKTSLEHESDGVSRADVIQSSILYFECYILNAVGALASYETDFKKNKNVSRRKGAKEFVERVYNASSDCVTALRYRPWSIGAWILLGRIFVELADVALDEREMALSTHGVYQPEELMMGDPDENAEGIILRAEVCFRLAQVLVESTWSNDECTYRMDVAANEVYSEARENEADVDWCGFGDDGDLFGVYGLNNWSTSRPWLADEDHPRKSMQPADRRLKAAICFGKSALYALKAREDRYWHNHWNFSVFKQSDLALKERPVPDHVVESLKVEMDNLEDGMKLAFHRRNNDASVTIEIDCDEEAQHPGGLVAEWREDTNVFDKQLWYYLLRRGKLKRKLAFSPADYLQDFAAAVRENAKQREKSKEPADTEVIYQLHAVRAKLLLNAETGSDMGVLELISKYSYNAGLSVAQFGGDKAALRQGLGSDILEAMKNCGARSGVQYSEHFFKSAFYTAVINREVFSLSDVALATLKPFFRGDAAARVIESTSDGTHRGYFYLIWNYRHTDTGSEAAIESDRKLVRWRFKMLSLYGKLLREKGDRKMLAGIISRLKRRAPDDLPVDGALLDDLVYAYAEITRNEILNPASNNNINNNNAAVSTTVECEASFRHTWDVFVETLRLVQGARRVQSFVERGQPSGVVPVRLLESKRPWCQVPIANTLHLERLRWLAKTNNAAFDVDAARKLTFQGSLDSCSPSILATYADSMELCRDRWKIEPKMDKLLSRRISKYRDVSSASNRQRTNGSVNGNDSSAVNTPSRVR